MLFSQKATIKLDKKGPSGTYPFRISKVIDGRYNPTRNIGYFLDAEEKYKPVYFPKGFEETLEDFFSNISYEVTPNSDLEVIAKVNHLSLFEFNEENIQQVLTIANITFYTKRGDKFIELFQTSQQAKVKIYKGTLAYSGKQLIVALSKCLLAFRKCLDENIYPEKEVEKEVLYEPFNYIPPEFDKRVFTDLTPGVYRNFQDVLDNNPIKNLDYRIIRKPRKQEKWIGTQSIEIVNTPDDKDIGSVWGFLKQDTVYISFQGDFFPLTISDTSASFWGYGLPNFTDYSNATFLVNNLTVLPGGLIGDMFNLRRLFKGYKKDKSLYEVDIENGSIQIHKLLSGKNGIQTAKITFFRKKKAEIPEEVPVYINDSLAFSLPPLSTKTVSFPLPQSQLTLCVGAAKENCTTTLLDPSTTLYYDCSLSTHKGNRTISIEETWDKLAKVHVEQAEKAERNQK